MDGELRKELEQALVDEIAKNLGDTIDSMSSTEVTGEELAEELGGFLYGCNFFAA